MAFEILKETYLYLMGPLQVPFLFEFHRSRPWFKILAAVTLDSSATQKK